jgi:6-pyruvoyltetrahydropterin/6-carboxytetrahydropterin synthase
VAEVWTLRKRVRFEAAHHLPHHDGKCRRVHGHSWEAVIEVAGGALVTDGPKVGMLVDYGTIGHALAPLVDDVLDHHDLNVTTGLVNPTSEALARFVFDWLADGRLPGVVAVTIHETCTAEARYARD